MDRNGRPTTQISTSTVDRIFVRDRDLVSDLMGRMSFTEMMFFQILGRVPSPGETRILDAVLVTLMEHGLTPSVIATRMVQASAPDALQSAVAAGLLCVGGTFVGTMEGNAKLLVEIVGSGDGLEPAAARVAARFRERGQAVPGFGHPIHRPDDPRSPRLLSIAQEEGVPGRHIEALRALSRQVDIAYGRHLTINATGAIAAVLCEIGIPWEIMRGFAVISRCAGLVGHILEETATPAALHMWNVIQKEIAYSGSAGGGKEGGHKP